jgi:hypothetical protein
MEWEVPVPFNHTDVSESGRISVSEHPADAADTVEPRVSRPNPASPQVAAAVNTGKGGTEGTETHRGSTRLTTPARSAAAARRPGGERAWEQEPGVRKWLLFPRPLTFRAGPTESGLADRARHSPLSTNSACST